jgi:hypothetical protein
MCNASKIVKDTYSLNIVICGAVVLLTRFADASIIYPNGYREHAEG